ncbi:MAG TPA: hypothetical protein DCS48_10690 [Desulfovibrio sp.]|nr:hypothetical protein [Desulfovibrio sp.]
MSLPDKLLESWGQVKLLADAEILCVKKFSEEDTAAKEISICNIPKHSGRRTSGRHLYEPGSFPRAFTRSRQKPCFEEKPVAQSLRPKAHGVPYL